MIKIIFLGTNGWYDTRTGNTVSVLIQSPQYDIILDAGNGFAKIGKYLTFSKPVYLFLSHCHLDHIIGLHTLNKFNFRKGLYITGPTGLKKMLHTMVQKPYTFPFSKLPYPTKVSELKINSRNLNNRIQRINRIHLLNQFNPVVSVSYAKLLHPVPTFGYRLEIDGKVITYCSDTGYCDNAVKLARNADLLINECAFRRGQSLPQWPHLNPDTAARLAKDAGAKKLILTHFDASLYPTLNDRRLAGRQARETLKNTAVAVDGMIINL
jgi:ribonuclease BN (tRNA processing enzyme)